MSLLSDIAMLVNDNFDKPLNRQIEDMIKLVPSDTQLYDVKTLSSIEMVYLDVESTDTSRDSIRFNRSGLANLKIDLKYEKHFINYGWCTLNFDILVGNSVIGSFSEYTEVRETKNIVINDAIVIPNFSFNNGDILRIRRRVTNPFTSSSSSTIQNIEADFNFYSTPIFSPPNVLEYSHS